MKQFFEFVVHHWMLWCALVIFLILLVYEELKTKFSGVPRLTPQDTAALMNHDDAVVIDLRSNSAFFSGHILGAINIPQTDLEAQMNKLEVYKSKSIILVDADAASSINITRKLIKHGYTKIFILAGGINAWKDANMPLVKK